MTSRITQLSLTLFFSAVTLLKVSAADEKPLNIILIMADDLGYETITANGGQSYQTPHLDKMANQGARFTHCYSQPICTPSRVQIMTGKYNVRNYVTFGKLPREEKTFAHFFKEAGYSTCIAGKWQLGNAMDAPQHFGFDEALLWQHTRKRTRAGTPIDSRFENPRLERNGKPVDFDNGEYGPDVLVDFICEFIEKKKAEPFFVYYPMVLTHCPFVPTPDSKDWNPKSEGSPTYKGDAKYFGDMVTYMDKLVGRIAGELEKQGLSENTLILFTGDNGTDGPVVSFIDGRKVGGGKGKMTDAGTRVPLIAYAPGHIQKSVIHDLVDFSDFLPTLCDIANVDISTKTDSLDGRSFLPQLLGEKGNPREWIYCWYSKMGQMDRVKVFARNQRYKLYQSGEFYDIENDVLEKSPLAKQDLTDEQVEIHKLLSAVITRYAAFRQN